MNLQAVLRDWLGRVRLAGSARLQVDIDPYSFLSHLLDRLLLQRPKPAVGVADGRSARRRGRETTARATRLELGHVGQEHLGDHEADPGEPDPAQPLVAADQTERQPGRRQRPARRPNRRTTRFLLLPPNSSEPRPGNTWRISSVTQMKRERRREHPRRPAQPPAGRAAAPAIAA